MKKSAVLFCIVICLATIKAAEWPGFRGDGSSHTELKDLPAKWSDSENIAWRIDLKGQGQSSPVTANGLVFVSSIGGETKQHLYLEAFSIADGSRKWIAEFEATQTVKEVNDYMSRGTPTPVADENGVYVFFESGDIFGLDHEGKTKWSRSIVEEFGEFKGNHGVGTSLVNTPTGLILSIDHDAPSYIMHIDKATGETIWKTERTKRVSWSTPLYIKTEGGEQIIVSSNGSVDSYALETGKQIWTVAGVQKNTVASPTLAGNKIYIGSSNPGDCMAINLSNGGEIAWRATGVTSSFGSPLVHNDKVYYVNRAGVIQAVNVADGSLTWQHRLPASTWASPMATADGKIYCFCKDGKTAIFEPSNEGPENEIVNELAVAEKDRIYGYAVVPGCFLVRIERELICIGKPGP